MTTIATSATRPSPSAQKSSPFSAMCVRWWRKQKSLCPFAASVTATVASLVIMTASNSPSRAANSPAQRSCPRRTQAEQFRPHSLCYRARGKVHRTKRRRATLIIARLDLNGHARSGDRCPSPPPYCSVCACSTTFTRKRAALSCGKLTRAAADDLLRRRYWLHAATIRLNPACVNLVCLGGVCRAPIPIA